MTSHCNQMNHSVNLCKLGRNWSKEKMFLQNPSFKVHELEKKVNDFYYNRCSGHALFLEEFQ